MVDIETLHLISVLNNLANEMGNGCVDFKTYAKTPDTYEGFVIYDDETKRIVCDKMVDEIHADIVSYYDDLFDYVQFRLRNEDGEQWIDVYIYDIFGDAEFVVDAGRWYKV